MIYYFSISLPLDSAKREFIVHDLPIPEIKTEFKSKPSTSLAASASTSKAASQLFGAVQVKKEKTSADTKPVKLAHTNGTAAVEPVPVKQEKKSPMKKESPKKNKIASGRSAISSFFSTKPIKQPVKSEPVEDTKSTASPIASAAIKKEPEEVDVKPTKSNNNKKKRTLSDANSKIPLVVWLKNVNGLLILALFVHFVRRLRR